MSERTLPAAAVPAGAVVLLAREEGGPRVPVVISKVHNSDPVGGRIRWETTAFADIPIGAATRVEVVSLP